MLSPLIIALDFSTEYDTLSFVDKLDSRLCQLKVGLELFTCLGPEIVRKLMAKGFKIFLDLKFHDIPNTVAKACRAAAELGVWMVNVHASGGKAMLSAAKEALENYSPQPLLIAVTTLTSIGDEDLNSLDINKSLKDHVQNLAILTSKAQLAGVVCAVSEVERIKSQFGKHFLTITPGIRLASDPKHDQVRVYSPMEAKEAGSDFIVVGRSITQAQHPMAVIHSILSSLGYSL